jgi:hypothetical protein
VDLGGCLGSVKTGFPSLTGSNLLIEDEPSTLTGTLWLVGRLRLVGKENKFLFLLFSGSDITIQVYILVHNIFTCVQLLWIASDDICLTNYE